MDFAMKSLKASRQRFGWFYYIRGTSSGIRKNHYMLYGSWQTLCGCHTVRMEDRTKIHFVNENKLFRNKKCDRCSNILISKKKLAI